MNNNERFKFRAWDKKDKLMHYDVQEIYFGALLQDKECVVMQCTGLKDKNGELIYEGDIVKYTDPFKKATIGYLCVDRFNLLTFTDIKLTFTDCQGNDFCEEWVDIVKAVFFTGNAQIEVIGNIYENKDLLEEE